MSQLHAKSAYPLRRAGIYSLPVELLSRIFILGAGYDFPYATSPFLLKPDQHYYAVPSSKFQLLVSHICHHWRQIALQTSSLWSMLHFREPAHIERAKEYLSRCLATNHLVDILVDTVAERDHIPGVTLYSKEIHEIFRLICPHVARWRAFHLKVRDHECKAAARQHLSTCGPAPNLETLQLYHFEDYLTSQNLYLATYRPPVMVFSNGLPRLRNISLIGVNLPWAQSPYLSHLHNLELALHPENIRPPYEYWESMLRSSPDLQTLSLHYSGPRVANGDVKLVWPTNKERIYIESLENLSLTDLDPDYLCRLMGRVILPGLKQLSLDLPDQDFTPFLQLVAGKKPADTSHLSPFNSSSPPHLPFPSLSKLETLVLTAIEANTPSLRQFLRTLDGLRTLEIHFASVSDSLLGVLLAPESPKTEEEARTKTGAEPRTTTAITTTTCAKSQMRAVSSSCRRSTVDAAGIGRTAPSSSSASASTSAASSNAAPALVPLLPSLETIKLSGLSGAKLEALIQYRRSFDVVANRKRGNGGGGIGRDGYVGHGIRNWMVKWSERQKGQDALLDRLVQEGWVAQDGTRVLIEAFDEDEEMDEEEAEVDDDGGGGEDEDEVSENEEDEGGGDEETWPEPGP